LPNALAVSPAGGFSETQVEGARWLSRCSSFNFSCSICRASFSDRRPNWMRQFGQQQFQMFNLTLMRQQLLLGGQQFLVLRQDQ